MLTFIRLCLVCQVMLTTALAEQVYAKSHVVVTSELKSGKSIQKVYPSIADAVAAAPENAELALSDGTFVVDNPIALTKNGIKLSGEGQRSTVIIPKNSGRPVFNIQGNGVTVKSMKIQGQTSSESGRASIAFNIADNVKGFNLYNSFIVNMGASSILGNSLENVLVQGNIIASSGDDGVQLSGRNIIISNNTIIGYFDEAIDILQSRHLIIKDNYVALGRIGITADNSSNFVIDHNLIVSHTMQGMVVVSKGNGNVSANVVVDAEDTGIVLSSTDLVISNLVKGKSKLGFQLRDIAGGVIAYNQVFGAAVGFDAPDLRLSLVSGNRYSDNDGKSGYLGIPYKVEASTMVDFTGPSCHEKEFRALSRFVSNGDKQKKNKKPAVGCVSKVAALHIKDAFGERKGPSVSTAGATQKDKKIGTRISDFLARHNPGFLSLDVNGAKMKSSITKDLYHTLSNLGQAGIGLVRYPFMMFTWDSGSAAVWDLYYEKSRFATVVQGAQTYEIKILLHSDEKLKSQG